MRVFCSSAAKIYCALQLTHVENKLEKIIKEIINVFFLNVLLDLKYAGHHSVLLEY